MKKSIIAVTAVAAIVLTMVFAVFSSALLLGDANNDGKVQASDARTILRIAAKIDSIQDEIGQKLCDVDGDGKVNASDARSTLRMASRLEPTVEYSEVPAEEGTTGFVPDVPTLPTSEAPVLTTEEEPVLTTEEEPVLTTEEPVEPTSEIPVEPTSEIPVEPTTEAPVEPTSEIPVEPTTEAPVEPTTEAPVEPTTEAPVEPTTEAPVEPTTEAPVEPTTEAPVDPADLEGVEFHDTFYIDADIINYSGGYEDKQSVKIAFDKEEKKATLGKTLTLYSQYVCTDAFMPGHEVGVLIRDELNLIGTGTQKSFYIINYEANEYLVMNETLFGLAGMDVNELMGENPLEEVALPTFTDLTVLNAVEEEYDGKVYQVVTLGKEDGYSKYYVEQHEDGKYYPVIAESYVNGQIVSKMVIRTFDTDPHDYTNPPTGMKEYPVRTVTALTDLTAAMPFFERLGIM